MGATSGAPRPTARTPAGCVRCFATLFHHGVAGAPDKLLSAAGREFLDGLELPEAARERIAVALAMIEALDGQLAPLEQEVRQLARRQTGCRALMAHYGIGELTAPTILCELGDVTRLSASRKAVRCAGLDVGVHRSDRRARTGKLTRIDRSKDERAQRQSEQRARQRAARNLALRAEQRPHFGRGVAAGADIAERETLFSDAHAAIETDARRRVSAGSLEGPIRRVACEPYPRRLRAEPRTSIPPAGRDNTPVWPFTTDVPAGERAEASAIGPPSRMKMTSSADATPRAKISGRAGEGALGAAASVTVPRPAGRGSTRTPPKVQSEG